MAEAVVAFLLSTLIFTCHIDGWTANVVPATLILTLQTDYLHLLRAHGEFSAQKLVTDCGQGAAVNFHTTCLEIAWVAGANAGYGSFLIGGIFSHRSPTAYFLTTSLLVLRRISHAIKG